MLSQLSVSLLGQKAELVGSLHIYASSGSVVVKEKKTGAICTLAQPIAEHIWTGKMEAE